MRLSGTIEVKPHKRRGKHGYYNVRGYTRKAAVGKGTLANGSPDGSRPGEEYQEASKTISEKGAPVYTDQKVWDAYQKRQKDGTQNAYTVAKIKEGKKPSGNKSSDNKSSGNKPLGKSRMMSIMERVEDKIASFVEKYTGKKYHRKV